jgi:hypothetical protein
MAFTWLLDKLMDWKGVVRYWPQRGMHEMLVSCGFLVHRHSMVDYLPYPHILYVATKTVATTGTLNPSGVRIIVADQQVE